MSIATAIKPPCTAATGNPLSYSCRVKGTIAASLSRFLEGGAHTTNHATNDKLAANVAANVAKVAKVTALFGDTWALNFKDSPYIAARKLAEFLFDLQQLALGQSRSETKLHQWAQTFVNAILEGKFFPREELDFWRAIQDQLLKKNGLPSAVPLRLAPHPSESQSAPMPRRPTPPTRKLPSASLPTNFRTEKLPLQQRGREIGQKLTRILLGSGSGGSGGSGKPTASAFSLSSSVPSVDPLAESLKLMNETLKKVIEGVAFSIDAYSVTQAPTAGQTYQDPAYQDPAYQDPAYQDPAYQNIVSQDMLTVLSLTLKDEMLIETPTRRASVAALLPDLEAFLNDALLSLLKP